MLSCNAVATTSPYTGQAAFTTAGTFSWTCPPGVTSVCAVCVGAASDSYFINSATVLGGAGSWPADPSTVGLGGTFVGDGGGNGGNGGFAASNVNGYWNGPGSGGAGGYSGKGGDGGDAGPKGSESNHYYGAVGGSVGIFGIGATGVAGTNGVANGSPAAAGSGGGGGGAGAYSVGAAVAGGPGSGGAPAPASTTPGDYGSGGYGLVMSQGGGGLGWKNNIPVTPGQTYTVVVGAAAGTTGTYAGFTFPGGSGAVRLIWGAGRAFPSTNTQDM